MKADVLQPTPFSLPSVSALQLPVQLPLSSPLSFSLLIRGSGALSCVLLCAAYFLKRI